MISYKPTLLSALVAGSLAFSASTAFAADSIVGTVAEGCKAELDAWCADVTPGEGRVLSCLAAREDKLSGQCEYALYQASAQLDGFVAAIKHIATECEAELEVHCSSIEPGEARLAQCLKANEANASPACKQAMADTQMDVK